MVKPKDSIITKHEQHIGASQIGMIIALYKVIGKNGVVLTESKDYNQIRKEKGFKCQAY